MDTTNEKKVMVTDEDLDSVSGGKGKGCSHKDTYLIAKRDDMMNSSIYYEEIACRICSFHIVYKHTGTSKSVHKDWFPHPYPTSWLENNFDGYKFGRRIV